MAQIIAEVLAKPTTFQQIPDEAYEARFTGFGMSAQFKSQALTLAVRRASGGGPINLHNSP